MRKIIGLLVMGVVFMFSGSVVADDIKESPRYRVVMTIKYNAVNPGKAQKIVRDILILHEEACDIEVNIRRSSQMIDITDGNDGELHLGNDGNLIIVPKTQ